MIMRGLKKPKKKKLNGGTKSGAGNEGNDGEGNSIMNSSNSNPQPLVLHTLDELKLNGELPQTSLFNGEGRSVAAGICC